MAEHREPAGKAEEMIEPKTWHVLYLTLSPQSANAVLSRCSFSTQEQMNTWLENNKSAIDNSRGHMFTVCGHLAKVKVQTIHTIETIPIG